MTGARAQSRGGPWRRPRSWPVRGWCLVADGADKLRVWEPLSVWLGLRAFALACRRVAGHLENEARAESVIAQGFGLRILVASRAVADELSCQRPALLAEMNLELSKITGPKRRGRRTQLRPLKTVSFRVASDAELAALPSHAEWLAPRPAAPARQPLLQARDERVLEAFAQLQDPTLHALLNSAYASATEKSVGRKEPRQRFAAPVATPAKRSPSIAQLPAPKASSDPVPLFAVAQSILSSLDGSGAGIA